jgi:hypothetical protein
MSILLSSCSVVMSRPATLPGVVRLEKSDFPPKDLTSMGDSMELDEFSSRFLWEGLLFHERYGSLLSFVPDWANLLDSLAVPDVEELLALSVVVDVSSLLVSAPSAC